MRLVVRRAAVALSLMLLIPSTLIRAQGIPDIKIETHLIDTTLSVHDAEGGIVTGLAREDFTVVEDGVPQKIRFFAHDQELPLSIGLIIDESGSQEKFVKEHEKDIEAFLQEVLEPNDQAFAVCFGNHLRMVSDFTSSAPAIMAGVRFFDKGKTDFPEIGPKEDRDLGTALYDAVFYGVTEKLLSIHQRRKVLVVFSDGEENSSEHDLLDAIEAAQNADVLIYAIRYTELKHGKMDAVTAMEYAPWTISPTRPGAGPSTFTRRISSRTSQRSRATCVPSITLRTSPRTQFATAPFARLSSALRVRG
jgi:Ca-activated chloride channel family protein